jgi:amino acid transporter
LVLLLGQSRIFYAIARDGLLPSTAAKVLIFRTRSLVPAISHNIAPDRFTSAWVAR